MAARGVVQSVERCKELWYTNMLLLGFRPDEREEQFKVPFTLDMFGHINKKGSEMILHFLLSVLAPESASQRFRDCWPIYDKKQEQDFRKTCVSWLGDIAKENPDTKLPRLCASLLLSPGGDKYYLFLYKLSKHVLLREALRRADQNRLFLSNFLTNGTGDIADKEVAMAAMQAHIIRNCRIVVNCLSTQSQLHRMWEKASSQLVREFHGLCKEEGQLKKRLQSIREEHKTRAANIEVGVALRTCAEERVLSVCGEMAHRKRTGKLDKTRELWVCVEEFVTVSTRPRDVVECVMATGGESPSLDARHITIHVPDVLLTDYQQLVASEQVGPLYQEGRLDLVSLTKLYNCALKQYRDCLAENEMPIFDQEGSADTVQQQRTLLATVTQLRAQLELLSSSLRSSLKTRLAKLQNQKTTPPATPPSCVFTSGRPPRIHTPHISSSSVGLLPPSPKHQVSRPSNHTHLTDLTLGPTGEVSTPEAVRNISLSVHEAASTCTHHPKTADVSTLLTSKLPKPQHTSGHTHSKHTSGHAHSKHTSGHAHSKHTSGHAHSKHSSGRFHIKSRQRSQQESSLAHTPLSRSTDGLVSTPRQSLPRVKRSSGRSLVNQQVAVDTLADQIATAVSSQTEEHMLVEPSPDTPDHQLHAVTDTMAALGQGAFVSKDLLPRTPMGKSLTSREESPVLLTKSPLATPTSPPTTQHTHPLVTPSPTTHAGTRSHPVTPLLQQLSSDDTPVLSLQPSSQSAVDHALSPVDHTLSTVPTDQLVSFETPHRHSPPPDVPTANLISFQTPIPHSTSSARPFQTPMSHSANSAVPFPMHSPVDSTTTHPISATPTATTLGATPTVSTPETWLADIEPPTPCPEDFDPSTDEDELSVELLSDSS